MLAEISSKICFTDLLTLNGIGICNFADDVTLCVCEKNWQLNFDLSISWFETVYMSLNMDKFNLCFLKKVHGHMWVKNGYYKPPRHLT